MAQDRFSFQKGFSQVKNKDVRKVRGEIMKALNIQSRAGWGRRLKGDVEPLVSEAEAIKAVFEKYSITDPWGGLENE